MESNAESAETCHRKVATSMLKVASDIYKTPLYRTAHSPENFSDEWAFFFPSQSKCTVSALFLHGFKGYNGHSDLQNTTKGAEIARQKITMLCAKMTKTRNF